MQRFFAPGRTELAGNHTDHQLGRVLAASVDVGITARATRRRDRRVCIHSKGYRPFTVALDDLAVNPRAYGKPWALVRGMAAAILDAGGAVGGFEAWASSALKPGGGLSSSAAFEILVGRIFNALYNGGAFSPEQLARFGQQAENRHFGKPSGLMDQLACALDGAVYIDFAAGEIAPVAAPFADMGLTLSLTDTGGSHAGLTAAYAALPADMCRVARRFGAETLSQVDPADFYAHRQPGLADDRAAHFFEENARVPLMRDALVHRDAETYLRLMNASGRSSEQLLRNIRATLFIDGEAIREEFGEIGFSDRGIEGAVALRMSRDAVDALIEEKRVKLVLDLKPALTEEVLHERIAREIAELQPNEFFGELLRKLVPKPLVMPLAQEVDIRANCYVGKITEEQITRLVRTLKGLTFPITDYAPFEYAVVTAGGVRCDEVNPYTMESLKVKGLYFAGEVLDIDANTGGYNLQIAFSTGRLAGSLKK